MAAFAMRSAMPIIEQAIRRTGRKVEALGTVVTGQFLAISTTQGEP
jgi:hypothetical protein